MLCPRCRHENPARAKFCLECGQRLALACAACGTELPETAKFCPECGRPVAAAGSGRPGPPRPSRRRPPTRRGTSPSGSSPPRSALEGERKPVTVLFCDLVGSTALAERLGPEGMHDLVNGFFEAALAEVHRYEGTVNQFLGDGFMALFGAPLAHEDHARRAALAALGIARALRERPVAVAPGTEVPLTVRMGLHTGFVVVGAIGDNLRMDYTAVGDTTHLAARLQQLAEPGAILASEATWRLVEGYVRGERARARRGQGPERAGRRGRLLGVGSRRSPLEGLGPHGASATSSAATGSSRRCWISSPPSSEGRGQALGIVGEPGVGKSRLLLEFRQRLAERPRHLPPGPLSLLRRGHPVRARRGHRPRQLRPRRRRPARVNGREGSLRAPGSGHGPRRRGALSRSHCSAGRTRAGSSRPWAPRSSRRGPSRPCGRWHSAGAAGGRSSSRSRISTGWTGRPRSTSRSSPRAWSAAPILLIATYRPGYRPALERSVVRHPALARPAGRGREPLHRPVAPARRGRRGPACAADPRQGRGQSVLPRGARPGRQRPGPRGGSPGSGHRARRPHRAHRPAGRGAEARAPDRLGAGPGVRPALLAAHLGRSGPARAAPPRARAAGVPLRAHDRRGGRVRLQARADAGRRRGDAPPLAPARASPPGRRGARAPPPGSPRRAGAPTRPSLRRGRGVGRRPRHTRAGPPRPRARCSRTGRPSPATTRPSRRPSEAELPAATRLLLHEGRADVHAVLGDFERARADYEAALGAGAASRRARSTRRGSSAPWPACGAATRTTSGACPSAARRSRPPSGRATLPMRDASPPRHTCASGSWS